MLALGILFCCVGTAFFVGYVVAAVLKNISPVFVGLVLPLIGLVLIGGGSVLIQSFIWAAK